EGAERLFELLGAFAVVQGRRRGITARRGRTLGVEGLGPTGTEEGECGGKGERTADGHGRTLYSAARRDRTEDEQTGEAAAPVDERGHTRKTPRATTRGAEASSV